MSLRIAVQMDPIERIRITGDSTFALLLEGERRGHAISYYTPERLAMVDGHLFESARPRGGAFHARRRKACRTFFLRCRADAPGPAL